MKIINKIMLCMFTYLTLSNLSTHCFFYNRNGYYPSNTFTGLAVGEIAGGGKGALIGGVTGATLDTMQANALENDRRRYYDDDYYYDRNYRYSRRPPKRLSRQRRRDLEAENEELRQRVQQYEGDNIPAQE